MRFVLFVGENYYPSGGWRDFAGLYDTADEAIAAGEKTTMYQWYNVVDLEEMKIIKDSHE
jgi:hypothetical protein